MRKLIIIALLAVGLAVQAQNKTVTTIYTGALRDTSTTYTIENNYAWGLQYIWSAGTDTLDATVKVYVSNTAANYVLLSSSYVDTLNAATGARIMTGNDMYWKYWKFELLKNHMDTAQVTIRLLKMRK